MIRILLLLAFAVPTICFAGTTPSLIVTGEIKNSFSAEEEITLLDDSLVTRQSWNESEDLKSVSPSGALRYETLELTDERSARLFYEIDPKTAQSKLLFFLDNYTWIKNWREDPKGIHLKYCANDKAAPTLKTVDLADGNYSEVAGCALRAIIMPNGEYWSFFRNENDHLNRSILTTSVDPIYSNLKPLDTTGLPANVKFDSEKIALSANSRYLALQDFDYFKNGTYVYDFRARTLTEFKFARGGGYARAIPSNDGKFVTSYGPSSDAGFKSDFPQIYSREGSSPVMTFVPSIREDDSPMWKFDDLSFSLNNEQLVSTEVSRARDPNTQNNRSDVDVFDVKTGHHLMRLQYSWIVRDLGHDRALVQSWDDRSYRVLDYSTSTPKISHRFAYPPLVDLTKEMHASFAGNTLAITLSQKTYFFELPAVKDEKQAGAAQGDRSGA